jgi:hypothetical protein
LATTGLRGVITHLAASLFQHFHHIEGGIRKKLVNKAGYKKLDSHEMIWKCDDLEI